MSITNDFYAKAHVVSFFTGTGVIANDLKTRMAKTLRVVVEGVGASNVITVKGKLMDQATFATTVGTVTNVSAGTSFDVSLYDVIEISCTTYEASGVPKVICSGFIY